MADDNLEDRVLLTLDTKESTTSLELADSLHVDHQKLIGVLKSIIARDESLLDTKNCETTQFNLTPEGEIIHKKGSHEARIFKAVLAKMPDGIDQSELLKVLDDAAMAKIGLSKALSNKWIRIDKETKKILTNVCDVNDDILEMILAISLGDIDSTKITNLKKRKLVTEKIVKYMTIRKGSTFKINICRQETDLTTSLLESGEWKNKSFKAYNFDALGLPAERGHLHPLLKVREQFRQIFLEMGFAEMPTNNFVESSFWNFDTLVVPQAHPARDSQDTFFISQPELCKSIEDVDLVERVRQAHQGKPDGRWPKGYQYKWCGDETKRNVLRTHTTAVTARMLYKLANDHQQSGSSIFKPVKFFSIDRVFRNETLDATHLAEFNQVEGVVVDEDLTLGDLMGILKAFFEKLGIDQLRFKPAYNPYTEPSMEIFSYHPGLSKWVELGNSGVFRPEMMQALGLPDSVTAIAWGLSLERPTMIKYKIDNIRDMVGHKVDIEMVQKSPICLF